MANVGRPYRSQFAIAASAGTPKGTDRSLLPLPSTRTRRRSRSISSRSSPHNSLTRIPVEYNSSTISRSRKAIGSRCTAPDSAASMAATACWVPSTVGNTRCAFGEPSRSPGSIASRPVLVNHAVNVLAEDARRAMVVRAAPPADCAASHDRNNAKSISRTAESADRATKCASNDRASPTYARAVCADRFRPNRRCRPYSISNASRSSGNSISPPSPPHPLLASQRAAPTADSSTFHPPAEQIQQRRSEVRALQSLEGRTGHGVGGAGGPAPLSARA